jgi:colanic acid/amylovoran biosynthesis glycosyltransferase
MKIGLVLSDTPAFSESFFRNKIKFLQEDGFEVILFVNKFSRKFDLCDFYSINTSSNSLFHKVYSKARAVFRLILSFRRSLKLYKQNKTDGFSLIQNLQSLFISSHIISHNLDWLHFGFATMAINRENLAKAIGAKLAVSVRGYDITVYPVKYKNCYNLLWKRIDKLHYLSNFLLGLATELGFELKKDNHLKITPAIDTTKFLYVEERNNPVIEILTVARLTWIKDIPNTLFALKKLKDSGIKFNYQIIGDGDEFEHLIFEIHQLGLREEVKLLGKKSQDEIIKYLSQADIYVQFSLMEGFCNSALEAQAAGCITIVSDAEALTENIIINDTGFIVERRNADILFQRILEAIELSPVDRKKMTSRASQRVQQQFNLEQQQALFKQFYV